MRVVRRAACEGAEKIENKMKHRVYNEDFKKAAVQKALSSKTLSISGTARQLGIPSTTFFQWKQKIKTEFHLYHLRDSSFSKMRQ